jgi:hypothetical protein
VVKKFHIFIEPKNVLLCSQQSGTVTYEPDASALRPSVLTIRVCLHVPMYLFISGIRSKIMLSSLHGHPSAYCSTATNCDDLHYATFLASFFLCPDIILKTINLYCSCKVTDQVLWAVPWPGPSIGGLSPRRAWCDPSPFLVGFMVEKWQRNGFFVLVVLVFVLVVLVFVLVVLVFVLVPFQQFSVLIFHSFTTHAIFPKFSSRQRR